MLRVVASALLWLDSSRFSQVTPLHSSHWPQKTRFELGTLAYWLYSLLEWKLRLVTNESPLPRIDNLYGPALSSKYVIEHGWSVIWQVRIMELLSCCSQCMNNGGFVSLCFLRFAICLLSSIYYLYCCDLLWKLIIESSARVLVLVSKIQFYH